MLFMAIGTIAQECLISTFPYTEGFELGTKPECWEVQGDNYWSFGAYGNYQGGTPFSGSYNALCFYSGSNHESMLVSPVFDFGTRETAILSFRHTQLRWGSDIDNLEVLYRTSDADSWHQLAIYTQSLSEWTTEIIVLPNLSSTYQIAFNVYLNYGYGVALDEIEVSMPDCIYSTDITAYTTGNSANISWSENGATQWQVFVSDSMIDDLSSVVATDVVAPMYSVTNLTANTRYYVYVRSKCDDSGYSNWNCVPFTTDCSSDDEYSENFENVAVSGLPECWRNYYGGICSLTSYSSYEGNYGMELHVDVPDSLMVSMPPISNLASKYIKFYAQLEEGLVSQFEVGYLDETNRFIAINDIDLDYSFNEYIVILSEIPSTVSKIAFRLKTLDYVYVNIDNIEVSEIPACMYVEGVHPLHVGATSVTIAWTDLVPASAWQVVVSETPYGDPEGADVKDVSSNPCVLTELNAETTYYAYVRASCGEGQYSEWKSFIFTTDCAPIDAPYYQDFENVIFGSLPNCWEYYYGKNIIVNTEFPFEGSKSLRMYSLDMDSALVALPTLYNTNNLMLNFYAMLIEGSVNAFEVGYMTDEEQFVAVENFNLNANFRECTVFFTDVQEPTLRIAFKVKDSDYAYVFIDNVNVVAVPDCLYVEDIRLEDISDTSATIGWSNVDGSSASFSAWQYVVSTSELSNSDLANPEVATVNEVSTNTVQITDLNPGTSYYIYVRSSCGEGHYSEWRSFSFYTDCPQINAPYYQDFEDILIGAFPDCWRVYDERDSYVRVFDTYSYEGVGCLSLFSIGGDSVLVSLPSINNLNSLMMSFYAYLDYGNIESFEVGYMTEHNSFVAIKNFELQSDYNKYFVFLNEVPDNVSKLAFRIKDSDCAYAFIDKINVTAIPSCMFVNELDIVDFDATFATITWTDYMDASAWQVVVSDSYLDNPETGIVMDVSSNPYDLTGLEPATTYYVYVRTVCGDDMFSEWSSLEFYTRPECWVDNVRVENVETTSATIVWDAADAATAWKIIASESQLTGDELDAMTPVETETPEYTLTELTPNTLYFVYVKAICSDLGTDWEMVCLNTLQYFSTLPYECDFEDETENANWTLWNVLERNKWFIGSAANNGGNKGLYISADNGITNTYNTNFSSIVYAYRMFNVEVAGDYIIKYDARVRGERGFDYARVFAVPVSANFDFYNGYNGIGENSLTQGCIAADNGAICNVNTWSTMENIVHFDETGVVMLVFCWKNDGTSGAQTPIAVDNISVKHVPFTITATAGENGTITPEGEITVEEGDNVDFTIVADEGYQIASVLVDGVEAIENVVDGVYTFANVNADHSIEVTFAISESVESVEAGSIAAYPNPNNGMFNIDFSNIEGCATFQLIDIKGAMIDSRNINVMKGETVTFNYDLRPGAYFVRIITSDSVYVEQIVVR